MTRQGDSTIEASERTEPLSEVEMKAGLRAIHSILVGARFAAYQQEDHSKIADILDWAEFLPEMLFKPGEFGEMFRPALLHLANKYPELSYALAEYDEALAAIGE